MYRCNVKTKQNKKQIILQVVGWKQKTVERKYGLLFLIPDFRTNKQ